ncbi:putative membrane protein [Opitutaceae bacterium TAV1]|nr:putative membrane protein [Opitutaceae bacterium TAV1]
MNWIIASLLSAFFLGCYNLGVKHAVRDNAVLPLLFLVNLVSALIWLVLMMLPSSGTLLPLLRVEPLGPFQHFQVLLKSALMTGSWMLIYFGLKRLPMSLASPVQSTGPVWILVGAVLVFGEHLSPVQWLGVGITLGSFLALSFVGAKEGIHFFRNKAIWFIVLGTLLQGTTGLYDKYLFACAGFTAATVQAWFSIYMVVLFLPLVAGWWLRWWPRGDFHWRWSIPLIVAFLLLADFIYYDALKSPGALISVVASLRRGDVLVAFAGGVWLFQEKNCLRKLPVILCLVAGIVVTMLG